MENQPNGSDHKPKLNPNDHLANERTFLAWLRTSIAIMGFGFVVVKFSLFVKQLTFALGEKMPANTGKGYSGDIGIILVIAGALISLLAYVRYRNIEKQLYDNRYYPSFWLSTGTTIIIVIVSFLLILYLLPSIR